MASNRSTQRAKSALINVLPRSAKIREADGSGLIVNDTLVLVTWVGEGWLRDVRPVLDGSDGQPHILVARRMSPATREAIVGAGQSWVDETGAAEISLGPIVVSREGQPPATRTEWSPSVLAVAEALLCGVPGTVKAAKEASGLSTGSCTQALRMLEDSRLLDSDAARGRNSARRVDDFDALLDAYASEVANESTSPSLQIGLTWGDPVTRLAEIGSEWHRAGVAWACTGMIAAAVLAPYLTSVASASAYVDAHTPSDLQAIAAEVDLRPMKGGRLVIRPFPTVTARLLSQERGGLCTAPWPRVYADLRTVGVRGEEAAEHLREIMNERSRQHA